MESLKPVGVEFMSLAPMILVFLVGFLLACHVCLSRRVARLERAIETNVKSRLPDVKEKVDELTGSVRNSEEAYQGTKRPDRRTPMPLISGF